MAYKGDHQVPGQSSHWGTVLEQSFGLQKTKKRLRRREATVFGREKKNAIRYINMPIIWGQILDANNLETRIQQIILGCSGVPETGSEAVET